MWKKVKAWVLPPVAMTDLGYVYCVNCRPEMEPVEMLEVGPNIRAEEKCDSCGAAFGCLPVIEVEVEAFVEYFQCKIF